MSLREKFEEYRANMLKRLQQMTPPEYDMAMEIERAFYAGAEAVMREDHEQRNVCGAIQAEIDHFRCGK